MKQIRLELESFRILKNRERWRIYFVVYTPHPSDPEKTILKFVPGGAYIRLKPSANNFFSFKPAGKGTDGLRLLQIDWPQNNYIDLRMMMMQSRKNTRTIGEKMEAFKKDLDVDEFKLIKLSRLHWYAIDKGFDAVATLMTNIQDRNMGFISMDEEFEEEFIQTPRQKRTHTFSTGEAEITWIWEIKTNLPE